ncbi:NAD(P)/FAD-dependent oxidoreductase [Xenorhabdus doucetiae]|uniref:FAD dependent oxidoreductase n=1 Tax=Xenorhabdus doucetiae TaxID=351671 RepID=A0A068QNU7_9GAMM|nr:FAD-dependent oxidoreductase [Xenorhabdus doucetiae]TYP08836.1 FAD dependent oxidoreductase [Xenorhabdus doucetiae]CDG16638.1 protein of unknown function [Xenorhabdus doucetiae]
MQTRGYAFFSQLDEGSEQMQLLAMEQADLSKKPLYQDSEGLALRFDGASFIRDAQELHHFYPNLSPAIRSALVFHRCGWFRTGEYLKSMLFEAMASRFTFARATVEELNWGNSKVTLKLDDGTAIVADKVIICAGQYSQALLQRIDINLPIAYESHSKVVLPDLSRSLSGMPFSFYADTFELNFNAEELAAEPALAGLQGQALPGHFHVRENWSDVLGEPSVQALWTYDCEPMDEPHPYYPDGSVTHTGIYTKMPDNLPCIGTLVSGKIYINSALSGFGYMFSQQASELIARHCMDDGDVPTIFDPLRSIDTIGDSLSPHRRGQM